MNTVEIIQTIKAQINEGWAIPVYNSSIGANYVSSSENAFVLENFEEAAAAQYIPATSFTDREKEAVGKMLAQYGDEFDIRASEVAGLVVVEEEGGDWSCIMHITLI